ncbi:MAG: hypothetical protein COB13_001895 [OCS116 cluster bacterium]|nr:hypothetical protein [OCS116 cluster bacterium]
MTPKKTTSTPPSSERVDEFAPQTGLRNSTLWKNGKPDPRLSRIIKLLARSAAQQFLEEVEQKEQSESKNT